MMKMGAVHKCFLMDGNKIIFNFISFIMSTSSLNRIMIMMLRVLELICLGPCDIYWRVKLDAESFYSQHLDK